jgi:hypothetical protein
MRKTFYLFFFLLSISLFSQNKIPGVYQNELGEKLVLHPDKTFEYTWGFDLASSWNIGTWELRKNKYIYLSNIQYVTSSISGGGQRRSLPPKKLILKDKELFTFFKSGKIRNKKEKSIMNANIYSKPWFEKISAVINIK